MVFTKADGILIKVLRQSKGYTARKLLEEFPDKDWSCSALARTLGQIDARPTWSADRKSGSSRERTVCTRDMQMSVQMATTLSTNCNCWYCIRTAKATFSILETSVFQFHYLNSCCSKTVQWILLKYTIFASER